MEFQVYNAQAVTELYLLEPAHEALHFHVGGEDAQLTCVSLLYRRDQIRFLEAIPDEIARFSWRFFSGKRPAAVTCLLNHAASLRKRSQRDCSVLIVWSSG